MGTGRFIVWFSLYGVYIYTPDTKLYINWFNSSGLNDSKPLILWASIGAIGNVIPRKEFLSINF